MNLTLDSLKKDELVSLQLRKLYEQYGYKKYRVRKFEELSLIHIFSSGLSPSCLPRIFGSMMLRTTVTMR